MRQVELVYFEGCPHVDRARKHLAEAFRLADLPGHWQEWDLGSDETPDRVRGYGSPTVLVDGRDVRGAGPSIDAGLACHADGAPGIPEIREAISG